MSYQRQISELHKNFEDVKEENSKLKTLEAQSNEEMVQTQQHPHFVYILFKHRDLLKIDTVDFNISFKKFRSNTEISLTS